MLLGRRDEGFQWVAAHLKLWLINRAFQFSGQGGKSQLIGEQPGKRVKDVHTGVSCADHKKKPVLCEKTVCLEKSLT